MRFRDLLVGLVAFWTALCVAGGAAAPAGAADAAVTEVPVTFNVTNSNSSKDPCLSDGKPYTIRGHITAPSSALVGSATSAPLTMYLYGYEGGEWNWDLKAVPGYDYAAEMAKHGHVSLTLDELGYGASGHPQDGNLTCQGALADIAHQIIQELRSGDYALGHGHGLRFSTIVLAGHDVGGQVAEIEAYSYSDIDGLIVMTMSDQGFTPWILERSVLAANDWCTTSPLQSSAGGETSYVHFVSDQEFRTLLFYHADPRVIDAAAALRNVNPCGIMRSVPIAVNSDPTLEKQVKVPVLVVFGNNDTLIWTRQGEEQQQNNFGSSDKTTAFIPNAGHYVMFERSVPILRATVSAWLNSRFPRPTP